MTAAPEFYEQMYAEHAPGARRVALALVPPDAAEDLVHEAFARIISAGTRPALVGPYLRAAVRNGAADMARRRLRAVPDPDPQPPPAPAAETLVMASAEQALAARAFASLPDRWREVLWDTEVEGLAPRQLTPQLGRSANAVAQLAARAREGLRKAYLAEHLGAGVPEPCRPHARNLPALARGTLPPGARAGLRRHLAGCAGCAALSAELDSISSRLGELLAPGAVTAGAGSLLARLLHTGRQAARPVVRHHLLAVAGTVASVAGAAVITWNVTIPPQHAPVPAGPGSPAAAAPGQPGAARHPGPPAARQVLADAPVPTDLPGGQLPGGSLPGGSLPGGPAPGGLLPGGSLPGGQLPGVPAGAGLSAGTGTNAPAGTQAGQVGLDAAGLMQPAAGVTGSASPPPSGLLP